MNFWRRFLSNSDCIASNEKISERWIGKDVEGSGRSLIWTYCPSIWGTEENHENPSEGSRSLGWDLNPGRPE
jgi:hypothetical protein